MSRLCRQFLLMLRKNLLLQRRKRILTVIQLLLPFVLAGLIILVRSDIITTLYKEPTFFEEVRLDSGFRTHTDLRDILYTPNNTATRAVMDTVCPVESECIALPVATEDEMIQTFKDLKNSSTIKKWFGGVVFEGSFSNRGKTFPSKLTLRIRPTDYFAEWHTDLSYGVMGTNKMRDNSPEGGSPSYFDNNFVAVQYMVTKAVLKYINNSIDLAEQTELWLHRMPFPPYLQDGYPFILQQMLPFYLVITFIIYVIQLTREIVQEKELKLKETMKMMGLNNFINWAAWFVRAYLIMTVASIFFLIMVVVPVGDNGQSCLGHSNPLIFLLFLLTYAISAITFSFAVSVFFKKANVATVASFILYVLSSVPFNFFARNYATMSQPVKLASCLFFNTGMCMGAFLIGMYEDTGKGLQWSNINTPATIDDNFTMTDVMFMLLADSAIHLLITWYVDAINPGEFGTPQPWCFPFLKSYWCSTNADKYRFDEPGTYAPRSEFLETDPKGLEVGIHMKNLHKVFSSGSKKTVAVDNVSLKMYEGQITALLGHNGAGKTTTISMLSGFLSPSSGSALVNGYDIRTDIASVRENLGLCPQHNVLFDKLTVHEHLILFGKLKGCYGPTLKLNVEAMLDVIQLRDKRSTLAQSLSGGQKRKLCVGIALVGNSKTIILDEPTSGMDPEARRQVWSILQQCKPGRTILLTTHYMEEADILGDRIAIMAEGVIKCCGTPLFLKHKYGTGYHLTAVKEPGCKVEKVTRLLKEHIPNAHYDSEVGSELSYTLPTESASQFAVMFQDLEDQSKDLHVASFGISVTTLEEVFLRVGEGATDDPDILKKLRKQVSVDTPVAAVNDAGCGDSLSTISSDAEHLINNIEISSIKENTEFNRNISKVTGVKLILQQCYAVFIKKYIHTKRNWVIAFIQLLVPVLFTISALAMNKIINSFFVKHEPPLVLDLKPFSHNYLCVNKDEISSNFTWAYTSLFNGTSAKVEPVDTTKRNMTMFYAEQGIKNGLENFNKMYLLGEISETNSSKLEVTTFFNNQPIHMVGIVTSYVLQALSKLYLGDEFKMKMINHPLPVKQSEDVVNGGLALGLGFGIAFLLLIGMALMMPTFVVFVIKERATEAQHIQFVSGLRPWIYWTVTFLWDMLNFLLPCLGLLVVFVAFSEEAFSGGSRLGIVFVLLLHYGWSVLPFQYVLQFRFRRPAGGIVFLALINTVTGVFTLLATYILSFPGIGHATGDSLKSVFQVIFPNFCFAQSFMNIYSNYHISTDCRKVPDLVKICAFNPNMTCCPGCMGDNCVKWTDNYFSLDDPGIGRYLLAMAAQGVFFLVVVNLIEYRVFHRLLYLFKSKQNVIPYNVIGEDEDVAAERVRISQLTSQELSATHNVVLQDFTKYFNTLCAVDHLSLGVSCNELFGLLGVNGAGKTSTFRILTGQEMLSDGEAYLGGLGVKHDMKQIQRNIGYCPQGDALIEQLTGREHLVMYARIRGIKEKSISKFVRNLLKDMTLDEHADKETRAYSGGNKRKLSTAISLVGDPPILFLDEPTTGVDPAARRQIWNILSKIRAGGGTIVLTSHSMEECDALCTRLAIMVNGRFLCLGSSQHLKNKFGQGYTLLARVGCNAEGQSMVGAFVQFIQSTFPGDAEADVQENYVTLHLSDQSLSLSRVFGTLEQAKHDYAIEDYSVSQTTLQEIFIQFAKHQIPPIEKRKNCCKRYLCCC